jgi:hypothetical protein
MANSTAPEERTVEYAIAALGRRRFLTALAAICDAHDVRCEWDLVGLLGMRKIEVISRGVPDAIDAGERETRRGVAWSARTGRGRSAVPAERGGRVASGGSPDLAAGCIARLPLTSSRDPQTTS